MKTTTARGWIHQAYPLAFCKQLGTGKIHPSPQPSSYALPHVSQPVVLRTAGPRPRARPRATAAAAASGPTQFQQCHTHSHRRRGRPFLPGARSSTPQQALIHSLNHKRRGSSRDPAHHSAKGEWRPPYWGRGWDEYGVPAHQSWQHRLCRIRVGGQQRRLLG